MNSVTHAAALVLSFSQVNYSIMLLVAVTPWLISSTAPTQFYIYVLINVTIHSDWFKFCTH